MPQTVLPLFQDGATQINATVSYERRDGWVTYFHGALPVFRHAEDDDKSFRMFTASLVVNGRCKQVEIVNAFGVTEISMKRAVKRFREGGAEAFYEQVKAKRKPRVLVPEVQSQAQALLDEGLPRQEVAERLEIKPDTLYRAILAGRLHEQKKKKRMTMGEVRVREA